MARLVPVRLALVLCLQCAAAAAVQDFGAGTTGEYTAATTTNSVGAVISRDTEPRGEPQRRGLQTENVIGYTSFEEPQTIVVYDHNGLNLFRRHMSGPGDVDPAPWGDLDPADEHELNNGPELSSVQFRDIDGQLRTGCGVSWDSNSEGYRAASDCVQCCVTSPQNQWFSCCSNGYNPLAYTRCSDGQFELGFRAFYRPTTGVHGLSSSQGEVGVVGTEYMYSDRWGVSSTMADGTQGYVLGNARRSSLGWGEQYPPADGFAYVVIDPVRVADYTSVEMSGWMHIDGGDANIDHDRGSWWSGNDRLRVWAQDASDSASQSPSEIVLLDTQGQDLDDYDFANRHDAGYLGPSASPYWYTRPAVTRPNFTPWAKINETIAGLGDEVSMCFGLSVPMDGMEAGNYWDVHKLVFFDNFRLVGVGPDRSSALCNSSACLPGTDYSGYVAGSVPECVECAAGMFDDDSDPSTPCVDCLTGTYSSTPGATECTACAAGTYSIAGAASISGCTACAAGMFDDDSDPSTPCVDCLTGTYSSTPGATECTACAAGTYSIAGAASISGCTACAAGMFDDDSDPSTPCVDCLTGTYSSTPGATECTACAAGTYSIAGAAYISGCTACAAGMFDDDSDPSTPCVDCLTGTYSSTPGATECLLVCQPGSYSPSGDGMSSLLNVECVACAAGMFDDDSDPSTPCVDCKAGTYCSAPGATECLLVCQPGSYSPSGDGMSSLLNVECVDCAAGMFDDDSDPSTQCALCRVGQFSAAVGQTQCTECAATTDFVAVSSIPGSSICQFVSPLEKNAATFVAPTNPVSETLLLPLSRDPVELDRSVATATGDFNGDGLVDAYIANQVVCPNSRPLAACSFGDEVLSGDGQGGFTSTSFPLRTCSCAWSFDETTGAVVGDFSGDALDDVYLTVFGADNIIKVQELPVDGTPTFSTMSDRITRHDLQSSWSTAATVGDFDGDGRDDVFVANFGQRNHVWLHSAQLFGPLSEGTLRARTAFRTFFFTDVGEEAAAASAYNCDGFNFCGTYTHENCNGHVGPLCSTGDSNAAATGDFNGDGVHDVFVANAGPNEVLLSGLRDDLSAYLDGFVMSERSDDSRGADVGDFNGDGIDDVFIANYNAVNEVLICNGQGGFTSTSLERSDNSRSVTVGDFNGDAKIDVFVANFEIGNEVLYGDGQGSFLSELLPVKFAPICYEGDCSGELESRMSSDAATADFNNDGIDDIIVTNIESGNAISVSDGPRGFTSASVERSDESLDWNSGSMAVNSGDFNGDGVDDIYVVNYNRGEMLLSDSQGGFASTLMTSGGQSQAATTGDFNSDGIDDVFVANWADSANVVVFGDRYGLFAEMEVPQPNGSLTKSATTADFNDDGFDDVFVVGWGVPNRVLLGNGQGGFASTELARSDLSSAAAVGDFNSDGFIDVFVANRGAENEVLTGDGQGAFASALVPIPTFPLADSTTRNVTQSSFATTGDFNGDGVADVFVASDGQQNEVLLSDGQGNFTSQLLLRTDGSQRATVGDFNGDGIDDIFVANSLVQGSDALLFNEVLIGIGTGLFSSTLLPRSVGSLDVAVGDFNGNEQQQLFVLNELAEFELIWYDMCAEQPGYFYHETPGIERGCYACPRYTTATHHSSTMCELCPPGTMGIKDGQTVDERFFCIPCEAGKARSFTEIACTTCPAGKFAAAGAPSCEPCSGAQVTNTEGDGATGCQQCTAGEQPDAARTACEACNGTTYSQFGNLCQQCDYPRIVDDENTVCTLCGPGEQPTPDLSNCTACQGNNYSTGILGVCQVCPPGKAANNFKNGCEDLSVISDLTDVSIVAAILADSNVLPKTSLEMQVANIQTVLTSGPEQDTLIENLTRDLAESLGIDPSLIQISGLRAAEGSRDSGRRRGQTATSNLAFDVVISGSAAASSVVELVKQLASPTSALMQTPTAGSIDATAAPTFDFQCPVGKRRLYEDAACSKCEDNKITADSESCENCPANQIPNDIGDSCVCKDGYYDASAGFLACYGVVGEDFDELDLARQDPVPPGSKCQRCDETCFNCASGSVTLNKGVALSEAYEELTVHTSSLSAPAAAFRCPMDGCLGSANSSQLSRCDTGYTGPLCAVCSDSYIRSSVSCDACSDTTGKSVAVAAVCVVLLFATSVLQALTGKIKDCCGSASDAGAKAKESGIFSELMAGAKILIGLLQIVTELPSTLSLSYPAGFGNLLMTMKVFLLDVFDMFSIDCIAPLSLHAKFIVVMLMPIVGIIVVHVIAIVSTCFFSCGVNEEAKVARKTEIRATKAYRSFFILFMLYPLLSRTSFHMFSCQRLSADEGWHPDDYSVDCDGQTHTSFTFVAALAVLVYPIGIPVSFFLLLRRDQKARTEAATQPGGSCAEQISAFEFLRSDYKADWYYFEVIVLVEKLILTGLLIFIDQGSTFQAFCGGVVAFVFFAVQCSTQPYVSMTDNILKAVSEAELFITLFISVVLRTDAADGHDTITADQYGTILTVAFFAAPTTFAVCFFYRRCCVTKAPDKQQEGVAYLSPEEKMSMTGCPPDSEPFAKVENKDECEDILELSPGATEP